MIDVANHIDGEERIEALRQWLSEKPFEWGPALATRTAFRVLPWVFGQSSEVWPGRFAIQLFHSLFIAWSTVSRPVKGHKHAADLSLNLLHPIAMHHEAEAYFASGMRQINLAIMAKVKLDKVDHSIRALIAFQNLVKAKSDAVPLGERFFWTSIQRDIELLGLSKDNRGAKILLRSKFVSSQHQGAWEKYVEGALVNLVEHESSFSLWEGWVQDIIALRQHNFFSKDGSADSDVKDRQVASIIVHNVEVEFWSRDAAAVNSDIKQLIADQAAGLSSGEGELAQIPAQNSNVISFRANDAGQIELTDLRHFNAINDDPDALDRYEECIENANSVFSSCKGSNSAGRLAGILEKYLAAAGNEIGDLRPSLFVQRGERLRQEIAAYLSHDTLLPPLADDTLLELRAWEASHNMLVGLDPSLMARDSALSGPTDRVADVAPSEIEEITVDADKCGLLAEGVTEIVVEAASLAPIIPDPLNRHTIWSFETGRNLVIEAFNIAMRHPKKALAGGAVSVTAVGTLGTAGTIMALAATSIPAGKFLLRHRQWIETRLGDSPAWKALFISLIDWLEDNTPFSGGDKER